MNEASSRAIAEGFLKGAFDVFDAMLSVSFAYTITDLQPVDKASLAMRIDEFPVSMRARVKSGGAVGLFFSVNDAARFAAMVLGNPPVEKESLDADDIATLKEVAEPCLGGGITNLMERFGRNVEQPENVVVEPVDAAMADTLMGFLDGNPVGVPFEFFAPDIEGTAFLAFSDRLETLMPAPPPSKSTAGSSLGGAEISNEEVLDILSGLDTDPDPGPVAAPVAAPEPREIPPNLDMVLDIRMVATARLGRIEMPIGEILSLGPGSIIQVGHLVDEPVELLVNDKLIARGDVVVVDEKFGLRITEIVSAKERIESLH